MFRIRVNGEWIEETSLDPHEPLLHFLRRKGLTGTKEGCAEGECGACAVAMVAKSENGARYLPVNSCLVLAAAVDGAELLTVEGLADGEELHPVQEKMVELAGSQCGFCTPGFVVSMFSEYYREGRGEEVDLESIGGNLCRCTGYRPIRDALVTLGKARSDRHQERLAQPALKLEESELQGAGAKMQRPATLDAALAILEQNPKAKILAGGTDAVVEINHRDFRYDTILSLSAIEELEGIREEDGAIVIGSMTSLSDVENKLHGKFRVLDQLWPLFSSRLIRNRGTIGGNIANASPIGDSPPALLSLDASLTLRSKGGERTLPLSEFFLDYKKTAMAAGELIASINIPADAPTHSCFYKVSKRVMDDISTVAAGFSLWVEDGTIQRARLGYGGVAAIPARATAAENALQGAAFEAKSFDAAIDALEGAFTPMTDHRGSKEYRTAMVKQLLRKWQHELFSAESAEARP